MSFLLNQAAAAQEQADNGECVRMVEVAAVMLAPAIQMRLRLNDEALEEYTDLLRGAVEWPFDKPLEAVDDGERLWFWDGLHRRESIRRAGWPGPVPVYVRPGTEADAILLAAGANQSHGVRRTNADKRIAVLRLLRHPRWGEWSDAELARRAGVSDNFVGQLRRAELAAAQGNGPVVQERRFVDKHGVETTRRVEVKPLRPRTLPPAPEPNGRAVYVSPVAPAQEGRPLTSVIVDEAARYEKSDWKALEEALGGAPAPALPDDTPEVPEAAPEEEIEAASWEQVEIALLALSRREHDRIIVTRVSDLGGYYWSVGNGNKFVAAPTLPEAASKWLAGVPGS